MIFRFKILMHTEAYSIRKSFEIIADTQEEAVQKLKDIYNWSIQYIEEVQVVNEQ